MAEAERARLRASAEVEGSTPRAASFFISTALLLIRLRLPPRSPFFREGATSSRSILPTTVNLGASDAELNLNISGS